MKNIMNLTPEEKFNQEVWWTLQAIKKELLSTTARNNVKINTSSNRGADSPAMSDISKSVRKLEEWGAFKVVEKYNAYSEDQCYSEYEIDWERATDFILFINQPKFDEIYKKFRKLTEKYQIQYSQSEEIFTNEEVPDRTAEIERQIDEARKWQAEQLEKDRRHRELMKQNRILATTTDKYTHTLDTIIEWAEFNENKNRDENSFSVDYYYFNFEDRMDDSKMLEKFLTELENNGCFEKYIRTNYTGGTRFSFIKVSINSLKKFREQKNKDIVNLKPTFNKEKSILIIKNRLIKIQKFSDQYHLLKILFEDESKDWQFSEIAELIDSEKTFKWKNLYNSANEIKKKIAIETGIKDFFITTTQSIKINENYLKKS